MDEEHTRGTIINVLQIVVSPVLFGFWFFICYTITQLATQSETRTSGAQ